VAHTQAECAASSIYSVGHLVPVGLVNRD
jgi:hypothetical protein